ncbi:MAG: hypothetical protein N3E47_08560, partial [Candidatus Bathyarchaeota archaeon]|nr:hypothetical protein [Candidatus Bathyarchaeota archaeon]
VIPGLPAEAQIQYRIYAVDNAYNIGEYFEGYKVIPEYPLPPILLLLILTILITVLFRKRRWNTFQTLKQKETPKI